MPLVCAYLLAIVLANLLATAFGPWATPFIAFVLIGFDLTVRDFIHEKWRGRFLLSRLTVLIVLGALLSFAFNPGSQQVAWASALAFGCAAIVDTALYLSVRRYGQPLAVMVSNFFSAITDTIIFLWVAFGVFSPWLLLLHIVAKSGGATVWYNILKKSVKGASNEQE